MRDTAGLPLDLYGDLWTYKRPVLWRNVGSAVRVVDQRASLLSAGNLIEDAALDKYQFVRDAYLQRRASQVDDQDGSWSQGDVGPAPEPEPASAPAVQPKPGSN